MTTTYYVKCSKEGRGEYNVFAQDADGASVEGDCWFDNARDAMAYAERLAKEIGCEWGTNWPAR